MLLRAEASVKSGLARGFSQRSIEHSLGQLVKLSDTRHLFSTMAQERGLFTETARRLFKDKYRLALEKNELITTKDINEILNMVT